MARRRRKGPGSGRKRRPSSHGGDAPGAEAPEGDPVERTDDEDEGGEDELAEGGAEPVEAEPVAEPVEAVEAGETDPSVETGKADSPVDAIEAAGPENADALAEAERTEASSVEAVEPAEAEKAEPVETEKAREPADAEKTEAAGASGAPRPSAAEKKTEAIVAAADPDDPFAPAPETEYGKRMRPYLEAAIRRAWGKRSRPRDGAAEALATLHGSIRFTGQIVSAEEQRDKTVTETPAGLEHAIEVALSLVDRLPDRPELLVACGRLEAVAGEYESAADTFRQALEHYRAHEVLVDLAEVLFADDKEAEGRATLEQAAHADGLEPDARVRLAELSLEHECPWLVDIFLASIRERSPHHARAVELRAAASGDVARREIPYLREQLAASPDHPEIRARLIACYVETKDREGLRELAGEEGDMTAIATGYLLRAGRAQEALEWLRADVDFAREEVDLVAAQKRIAILCNEDGRVNEEARAWLEVLEHAPDDADVRQTLADIAMRDDVSDAAPLHGIIPKRTALVPQASGEADGGNGSGFLSMLLPDEDTAEGAISLFDALERVELAMTADEELSPNETGGHRPIVRE